MKGPRRLLLISSTSALYGGEHSLLHVVRKLDRTAWEPHFVVPSAGPFERILRAEGYPVSLFDVTARAATVPRAGSLHSAQRPSLTGRLRTEWPRVQWLTGALGRVRAALPTVFRLAALIRSLRADLVHLNLHFEWPIVSAACQLVRVPLVIHVRNMIPVEPVGRLDRYLFQRASRVICISDAVRAKLFETELGSPALRGRVHQVPDARDLEPFRTADRTRLRRELGVSGNTPLIGMVARFEPMKGQDVFLEAARLVVDRLPGAHFVLAGDTMRASLGPFQAKLEAMAKEPPLAGRVSFLGYRNDVPEVLAGLDCFVHPSRRGAFVSVLIEAMASGVPAVVSDLDGIPECVGRDGAAELVAPVEPLPVAMAILRVLADPLHATAMGAAGRERAARLFDAGPLARATEDVFRLACGESSAVSPLPSGSRTQTTG